jgi:O-antigen/teichoic acid export membrane protein
MHSGKLTRALSGGVAFRIFSMGTGVITSAVLARSLGPTDFGFFSLITTIVAVLAVPTQFGLSQLSAREIALYVISLKHGLIRRFIRWTYGVNLGISIVLVTVYLLVGLSVNDVESRSQVLISAAAIYLMSLNQIRAGIMQGLGRVVESQLPDLFVRPALMLVFIFILVEELDLSLAIQLYVLALFLSTMFGGIMARYYLSKFPVTSLDSEVLNRGALYRSMLPLGGVAATQLINSNVDILMLGFMSTDENVGIYKIAIQFGTVVLFGERAVQLAVMPMISAKSKDIGEVRTITKKSSRLASVFSFTLLLLFVFLGEPIITYVLGKDYLQSHIILVVLALGYFISSLIGPGATVLTMMGYEKQALIGVGISLVVNVFLNIVFVWYFGVLGAAIATFCALLLSKLYMHYCVKSLLGISTGVWG